MKCAQIGVEIKIFCKKSGVIMGRLKKKRGKTTLSGPAGNVEFYSFGGQTYFKSHAKKHKKSHTKKAVHGRNNFASVVRFAQGVNKIQVVKEIWNRSAFQGRNAFQKIIKNNMLLARDGNLTIKNFIIPKGNKLFIPDLFLEEDTLKFDFDVYGLIRPPLTIHIFFYLYNHRETKSFACYFIYKPINIDPEDVDLRTKKGETKYIINKKLNEAEITDLSNYKDTVILIAVTGTPFVRTRKGWTDTVGFDIPLI
jgi:hypothetical protein